MNKTQINQIAIDDEHDDMDFMCKRFINGIIRAGYDFQTVKTTWVHNPEGVLLKDYLENYLKKGVKEDRCVCMQKIKVINIIVSPDYKDHLIIGKDCAKKFIDSFISTRLKECDKCKITFRGSKDTCKDCLRGPKSSLLPQCGICHKITSGGFKFCFECNEKRAVLKTSECSKCYKPIEAKYKCCFTCR